MFPLKTRPCRFATAEAIEGRWLLSAPDSQAIPDTDDSGVELVEYKVAEEDESDLELDPSELPKAIVRALQSRYPGARIIEAELSEEEGEPEYGLTARFRDEEVDLTLSPDGQIIETEEQLSSAELPPEVLEWVRRNFPGAQIDEAVMKTAEDGQSYEVTIASADGEPIEATLRVNSSPDNAEPPDTTENASSPLAVASAESSSPQRGAAAFLESDSHETDGPAESLRVEASEADPADVDPVGLDPTANPEETASTGAVFATAERIALSADDRGTLTAEAISEICVNAASLDWMPQIAGIVDDILAIDLTGLERWLDEFLDDVDLPAANWVGNVVSTRGVSRLTLVLVICALLRVAWRKRVRGPVLALDGPNSSWSWVIGAPSKRS